MECLLSHETLPLEGFVIESVKVMLPSVDFMTGHVYKLQSVSLWISYSVTQKPI